MIRTDRSRIITRHRCPREYYYQYHHLGTGIEKVRKSAPLVIGDAFHEGIGSILLGVNLVSSVVRAVKVITDAFDARAIEVMDHEWEYARDEQVALVEGLLTAWYIRERQSFFDTYQVIEVEKEGLTLLSSNVGFMFRPDALVQDSESADLFIVSWKTCATFGASNIDDAHTDMQSISEVVGREVDGVRIEGVIYRWAEKGRRYKDEWDNIYKTNSPLIYGWKKLKYDPAKDSSEWSHSFKWTDESGNHTLGKGWKKVPIWLEYPGGVRAWVQALQDGEIFPRDADALGKVFPQSIPIIRTQQARNEWRVQTVTEEEESRDKLFARQQGVGLEKTFPQHTHSCRRYNSRCQFWPICHENEQPTIGDLYQIRVANHPEEDEE